MCQQESNGCHSTFCEFHINGQMCLHLDLKNKSWMEFHPGCRLLKETLESDRYVTNLFVLVLNGDCMKSLNQSAVLDTKGNYRGEKLWSLEMTLTLCLCFCVLCVV